jgi:hypothetical protein
MPLVILIFIFLIFLGLIAWIRIGGSKKVDSFIDKCLDPEKKEKNSKDFIKEGQKLFDDIESAEKKKEEQKEMLEKESEDLKSAKDSVFYNEKEEDKA